MKRWNHARVQEDQFMRLKLLDLVPKVLKKSHTVQGMDKGNKFERVKVSSRWETKMTYVEYHEFIAVLKAYRIRVIVKKIDNGPYFFWSLIPSWKQGSIKRQLFIGNLEED